MSVILSKYDLDFKKVQFGTLCQLQFKIPFYFCLIIFKDDKIRIHAGLSLTELFVDAVTHQSECIIFFRPLFHWRGIMS